MTDEQRYTLKFLRFMLEENRLFVAWTPDIRLGHGAIENLPPDEIWQGGFFVDVRTDGHVVYEYMLEPEEYETLDLNSPFLFRLWPKTIHERLAMITRLNTLIGDRPIDPRD